MPINTEFLNAAKDRAQALKRSGMQFARKNPRNAMASAAAALLAPALLQNENRDYTQTAAFTTPLIGAISYGVSNAGPSVRQNVERIVSTPQAHKQWRSAVHSTEVTYSDIANAQQAYESQRIALAMFQNMKRRFYSGRLRGKGDFDRQANSLSTMIGENLNQDSRLRYISNSIHAERLRTSSASELAAYGRSFLKEGDAVDAWAKAGTNPIPKKAPLLTPAEIKTIIDGEVKAGNHAFIKGMSSRMQRMDNLILPTGSGGTGSFVKSRYNTMPWDVASGIQSKVMKERPDLYQSIKKSISSGLVDASQLTVKTTEDGGIAGFIYPIKGRKKGLWISYVGENGAIETGGSTFGRTGVARRVYTADSWMKSDTYAFESLGRGFGPRQVREELKRSNMFGLVDSSTDFSTYVNPEYGEYVVHNGAQKLRQYQGVPSNLYGFEEGKGFAGLNPQQKMEAIVAAADTHQLTKVGSEAGAYEGVLESRHLDELSLNPSREKQNSVWRAETKGVRITRSPHTHNPNTWSTVRDRLDPFFQSNKLQLEGVQDHGVGVRTAGITPGEQTLFGEMPDVVDRAEAQIKFEMEAEEAATKAAFSGATRVHPEVAQRIRVNAYMESFAAAGRYDVHAMSILKAEHGLSHDKAKEAWKEMVTFLSDPNHFRVMKKAGRVGEGEFLTERNLYGAQVERYVRYDVHESTIPDWDFYTDLSIEERFGAKSGQQVILGMRNGNPVTAGGVRNYIENVYDMGDGLQGILVRETKDIGTGTKWNVGSQKGLQHAFEHRGDSEIFRQGLNVVRSHTDGGFIPKETNMFVSQIYNTNKSSELQDDLASIAGDTLRRVQEQGDLESVMTKWKDPLDKLGLVYRDDVGTLEWDVATTRNLAAQERIDQQTELLKGLMEDVGARIRNHQLKSDEFMASYASYAEKGGQLSWMDYVNRYANPQTARITDDVLWNSPKETKLAYYTVQQMVNRGQHAVAADLLDRLKYDGDPGLTRELLDHFNGDKGAITDSMTLAEATDNRNLKWINTSEERANTLFDPGFTKADRNFNLVMPDGSSVPVLGHEAYGGKVNRFGTGEFSASEHESELYRLIQMHQTGAEKSAIEAQRIAYEDSLKQFLHGKESFYRSGPVDPLAQTLRFGTRPSSLRYADGTVNPFEVGIGRNTAAKIQDKTIRDALFRGEDVTMMGTREPVSHTPMFKVTIDDALNNTNIIGMDEGMRGLLMADADGDMIMAHFLNPKSQGHVEAMGAVFGEESIQRHSVQTQQRLVGVGDETRKMVGKAGAYKPFSSRLAGQKFYTMAEVLTKRSTAGSIGASSNTYSLMMAALEENSNITSSFMKDDLSTFFFQAIKQGPISAAKLKGAQDMDIVRALGIDSALRGSMMPGGKFEALHGPSFYGALNELAKAADGAEGKAFQEFLQENRETLRAFHSGFDREKVNQAVRAMTTPADKAAAAKQLGMGSDMFTYAQAASTGAEEARTAATGAATSAEVLGAINRAKTTAENIGREVRSSKLGIIIGAGIAAAAIAGVATTRLDQPAAAFGRDSSSQYRPEEKAPQADHVPGEGAAGSRAPSRPARTVVPAPAQTSTGIVAPLGEARDLDVQLRAGDRQRAHHTARMMSRMATDGDATVTVNYRDQMKPNSYRTRERMRDALES
jgi:hypothetical protein